MILLTGGSGFLGKIISQSLSTCDVVSLSRGTDADITCNLYLKIPDLPIVDLVIHAAGKAHYLPTTEAEKHDFYNVNVNGTINLLRGLERLLKLPKCFVFISSVAVYGLQAGDFITEDAPLNAKDPYGLSKIQAEEIIQEWCDKNKVLCTILRLPLLVGPYPTGNLKAMIDGIKKGYYFDVAGGLARKSMVMAADVARIIPTAASIGGIYNLTDGIHPKFLELSKLMATQLGKSKPYNIPLWVASLIAKVGDIFGKNAPLNSDKLKKITSNLTFDDTKAVQTLNWRPTPILNVFKIE